MTARFSFAPLWLIALTSLAFSLTGGVSAQENWRIEKSAMVLGADPALVSISPASFANGVNLPATISGSHLDTITAASLGSVALRNLAVLSSTQVTALVPWSIAPGSYDLMVTNASGQSATLAGAVTVSAGTSDWTSNGPYGGELYDVVLDPAATKDTLATARLYVSAFFSGVFKSQDGGANWDFSRVAAIADRVQIAYPTLGQPPVLYLGELRSLDYGQTWQPTNAPIPLSGGIWVRPFLRPSEPSSVYWGFDSSRQLDDPLGGLYKSPDLGVTWAMVSGTTGLHVDALAFDPDHPTFIVMGTGSGDFSQQVGGQVYTSTDNGLTWSQPITFSNKIGQLYYAPRLYNGHRGLFAIPCNFQGCEDQDTSYQSVNDGQTWTSLTVTATHGGNVTGLVYDLAFHDSIQGLMWAAVGDGYYSVDGGASWNPVGAGLHEAHGFAVVPGSLSRQTTTLFAATEGGLYRSTDGGDTWQETDNGLGAVLASMIAISPFNADEAYAATQAKGLLHTYDGGRSWQSLPVAIAGVGMPITMDPFADGKVYLGDDGQSITVRVSSDHGSTFITHTLTLPPAYVGQAANVAALASDPQTQNRLLAGLCMRNNPPGPGFIYASTNGGSTWNKQSPDGTTCISQLMFDPNNSRVVYAGATGSGLMRSSDRGVTWTLMPHQATQFTTVEFLSIEIDPRDSNSIYLCTFGTTQANNGGIYATHDGGNTWVHMTGATDGGPIWSLKFVQVGQDNWLYAATIEGLKYLKTIPANPAAPWQTVNGIAGVANARGFNAVTEDGRVVYYIGTSGGTIPLLAAASNRLDTASGSQNIAGGIYRRMDRISLLYLPLVTR